MKKGRDALEKCEDMVNKLGLFSSNETKEDISTTNLKYLLVISYFGENKNSCFCFKNSWTELGFCFS